MSNSEWYVLVDEDIGRRVVDLLREEGVRADHVAEVLVEGADDGADILPYTREHEAVLVRANWRDFTRFDPDRHCGCLVEFGQDETAMDIASAVLTAIDQYGDPSNLNGWDKPEFWLEQSER